MCFLDSNRGQKVLSLFMNINFKKLFFNDIIMFESNQTKPVAPDLCFRAMHFHGKVKTLNTS
jgi:hypothetical protein